MLPISINKNDQLAIEEFLSKLHNELGKNVVSAKIYGSKVAGTDNIESDIDILVILKTISNRLKTNRLLSKIESQLNIKYGVLVSSYPVEKKYYSECSTLLFFREIIDKGITL